MPRTQPIDLLEAYLLPPALVAIVTAAILTARAVEVRGLYAAGLGVAVLPSLALLVLVEPDAATAVNVPWRAFALLAAGAALLIVGAWFVRIGRRTPTARVRTLDAPTCAAAFVTAVVAWSPRELRFGWSSSRCLLARSFCWPASMRCARRARMPGSPRMRGEGSAPGPRVIAARGRCSRRESSR